MRRLVVVALLAIGARAFAGPYDDWAAKNAKAAKTLTDVVPKTPGGAKAFREWAEKNPDDAKKVAAYMKEHPGVTFDDAASKLKIFSLLNALVVAGIFSQTFEKWAHHFPDGLVALFDDPAAVKTVLTAPEGSKGDLLGALAAAAPPARDSDEMYAKYSAITIKELPYKGPLHKEFGEEFHAGAVGEWSDQAGYEVLKTYIAATKWVESINLANNLPTRRLLKGITFIRKDKTRCMVFFDGLVQEWNHRDALGRDYWNGSQYSSSDWQAPRKIDCKLVK